MLGFLKSIPVVGNGIDAIKGAFEGIFKALPPGIQKFAAELVSKIPPAALGMAGGPIYGSVAQLVQESIVEGASETGAKGAV